MASGSDDFSSDLLDTNWAVQTGQSRGLVSGGVWRADDTFDNSGHRRTAETYSADHYSQATATNTPGGDREESVRCRCAAAAETYYAGGGDNFDIGGQVYRIWKVVAGTFTILTSHASQEMIAGDVVRLTVVGTALTLTVNSVQILSTTDATIATGQPGFGAYSGTNNNPRWDTWSAADVGGASDTPRTPTVGAATVTGNAPGRVVGTMLTPQTP